ncbi:MAG: TraR/DksA family transcriptional regulator [Proteobacteria bacterium]|jgi:DnaK suppressor protein|nr:TraR/DksA family transcriptional regulator [Pseudomonadota bacterium]
MNTLDASMRQHFHQQLARREAELRLLLRNSGDLGSEAPDTAPRDVVDFKELATEQTQATVDDAKTNHAVHELDQLAAARRRLDDHSYGLCLDCGDAIDLRRLEALPATPYCTSCQAVHEHERPQATRR